MQGEDDLPANIGHSTFNTGKLIFFFIGLYFSRQEKYILPKAPLQTRSFASGLMVLAIMLVSNDLNTVLLLRFKNLLSIFNPALGGTGQQEGLPVEKIDD